MNAYQRAHALRDEASRRHLTVDQIATDAGVRRELEVAVLGTAFTEPFEVWAAVVDITCGRSPNIALLTKIDIELYAQKWSSTSD